MKVGGVKKSRVILMAGVISVAAAGCAQRTCYKEAHIAFEKVERSMHLPPGTGVAAELDSNDDVQAGKPGIFLNLPSGCYWLVETRQNTRFGQVRGLYLYNADNGREVRHSTTRSNVDQF